MSNRDDNLKDITELGFDLETGIIGKRFSFLCIPADIGHTKDQWLLIRNIDLKAFHATERINDWIHSEYMIGYHNYAIPEDVVIDTIGHKLFLASEYNVKTNWDWAQIRKWEAQDEEKRKSQRQSQSREEY